MLEAVITFNKRLGAGLTRAELQQLDDMLTCSAANV